MRRTSEKKQSCHVSWVVCGTQGFTHDLTTEVLRSFNRSVLPRWRYATYSEPIKIELSLKGGDLALMKESTRQEGSSCK